MMLGFVLLDDCHATVEQPTSRLYTQLQQILTATDAESFVQMIRQMQTGLRQGYYAVAVLSYETGVQLPSVKLAQTDANKTPQPSHILLFKNCQHLSQLQVNDWLQQQIVAAQPAGIADLRTSVDQDEFIRAVERIQRYIASGDTYQVNYTFRFRFQTYGTIFLLYQRLRERQRVPFGALIGMPDDSVVVSLSPELFIQHRHGELTARPMKGTSAACVTDDLRLNEKMNSQRRHALAADEKNRAENLMIVDLLRNDLGRIAQPGSVQVPALFEVQQFNTVLQMTSTVTARCRDDVTLVDIFKALYPCGSVTGAPKIRTLQIIDEVETAERGIYTGAIGWFDPVPLESSLNNIPEFCLSVPIRTLCLQAPQANGNRSGVMGVGAGIVFDSVALDEYQECQLKARFLTGLPAQFALFETMYATRRNGCRNQERHLKRLTNSAQYFGVPLDLFEIKKQLQMTCAALTDEVPFRVKLSVTGLGQIEIQSALLMPVQTPVKIVLANSPQSSHTLWLQHKTTQRAEYDRAWKMAENQGAFDMLFFNEHDEITEGARSNFLFKLDGRWYTPPLGAGVLPGVMRSVLMDDLTWNLTERNIRRDQLALVEEIAVCNALRGVLSAICSGTSQLS